MRRQSAPTGLRLAVILLFAANLKTAASQHAQTNRTGNQEHLVCKKPDSHRCVTWHLGPGVDPDIIIEESPSNATQFCGLSDLKRILPHRKFITVKSLGRDGKSKIVFCKGFTKLKGNVVNWKQVEKALNALGRIRRQAPFSPRGRYRGQTQSQYLAIDRGNGKDEGKAEAHSAADSSRASVSGNSGMGQAQSQSIFDPNCDGCYGKSDHEVESLKRGPYIPSNGGNKYAPGDSYGPSSSYGPGNNGGSVSPNGYSPGQSINNIPYSQGNGYRPGGNGAYGSGQAPSGSSSGNGGYGPNDQQGGTGGYGPGLGSRPGTSGYNPSTGNTPGVGQQINGGYGPGGQVSGSGGYGPGGQGSDSGGYGPGGQVSSNGGYRPNDQGSGSGGYEPGGQVSGSGGYGPGQGTAPVSSGFRPATLGTTTGGSPDRSDGYRPDSQLGGSGSYVPGLGSGIGTSGVRPSLGTTPGGGRGTSSSYEPAGASIPGSLGYGPTSGQGSRPGSVFVPGQNVGNPPDLTGQGPGGLQGSDSIRGGMPGGNGYNTAQGLAPSGVGGYTSGQNLQPITSGFVPQQTSDRTYGAGHNGNLGGNTGYSKQGPLTNGGYVPVQNVLPGGNGLVQPGGNDGYGSTNYPSGYSPGQGNQIYGPGQTGSPVADTNANKVAGSNWPLALGPYPGPQGSSVYCCVVPNNYGQNIGSRENIIPSAGTGYPHYSTSQTAPGVTGGGNLLQPSGAPSNLFDSAYGPGSGTQGPNNIQTPYDKGQIGRPTAPGSYGSQNILYGTRPGVPGTYDSGISGAPVGQNGIEGPGNYGTGLVGVPGGQNGILASGTHSPGISGGPRTEIGMQGPGTYGTVTGQGGQNGIQSPGVYGTDIYRDPARQQGIRQPDLYGVPGNQNGIASTEVHSGQPGGNNILQGPGNFGTNPTSGSGVQNGILGQNGNGSFRPGFSGGSGGNIDSQGPGIYNTGTPAGIGNQNGLQRPGTYGTSVGPGGQNTMQRPGTYGTSVGPGGQNTMQGPGSYGSSVGPGSQNTMQGPGTYGTPVGSGGQNAMQGPGGQNTMQGTGTYGTSLRPGGQNAIQGPGTYGTPVGPGGQNAIQGPGTFGTPVGPGGQNVMHGPGGQNTMQGPGGQNSMQGPGTYGAPVGTGVQTAIQGPGRYGTDMSGGPNSQNGMHGSATYGPGLPAEVRPYGIENMPNNQGGNSPNTGTVGGPGTYGQSGYPISGPTGTSGGYPGRTQLPSSQGPNGQIYGENTGFYGNEPKGATNLNPLDNQQGFNSQGNTLQGGQYNGAPQNVVDPNSIAIDGDDSEAEAIVNQAANGTTASASSKGGNDKGRAQTNVHGTYTGGGSFQAQAQITGENKEAESEVNGGKEGASSSATGSGRNNKSQASVQLGSETGSIQTQSQSNGAMHSSNSQVQGSVKGGMADAQARGPGSTSSQAQIGFTPYKDGDKSHELLQTPFTGGGIASAQSSGRTGQSQSQLHGTFKYGITYNGAAQAGASLDKDAIFPHRLAFDKIDVFDESQKNVNLTVSSQTDTPSTELTPLSEVPLETKKDTNTEEVPAETPNDETMKNSESRYSSHTHLEHHKTDTTPSPAATPVGNRRSFQPGYDNAGNDYEYTTDKTDVQSEEYDTDPGYGPDGNDATDVEQNMGEEFSNYDEYNRDYQTHQSLQSPRRKGLEVQQSLGGNTQHIVLGSLNNQNAEITQRNSEKPDESKVYQPGEKVPGIRGYRIPMGFTGSVKSVASKENTYVVGSKHSPSQAQTVTLTPGTGKLKYLYPPSHGKYISPKELRSLQSKDPYDDRYVSVSKSVTRALDGENNIRKQYSHTYYTKSSSCGYFTFTCTMVSGVDGRKKVCKPKIPTNPDGTPIRC